MAADVQEINVNAEIREVTAKIKLLKAQLEDAETPKDKTEYLEKTLLDLNERKTSLLKRLLPVPAPVPRVRAKRKRVYKFTIIGPHRVDKKKHPWTGVGRLTLAKLQAEIPKHFPDCPIADYTLTWKFANDVIEHFEYTLAQWGDGDVNVELKLKLLTKPFLNFSLDNGLAYLGLNLYFGIQEAAAGEFPAEELKDDAPVDGCTACFGDLLQHFAKDLYCRRAVRGNPEVASGQTRRDYISPVFVMAALLMKGMRLEVEPPVEGSLGNGPVDYAFVWDSFKVLTICERKKPSFEDDEGRVLAAIAATREEYVRGSVRGIKRKQSEIDDDLPVPSTAMLCTATYCTFYQYYPGAGEGRPRRVVKSRGYPLSLLCPDSPDDIKAGLRKLVCTIVAALKFQKAHIEAAKATKKLKLLP